METMKTGTKFEHRISKGSRFNQIYIPREMERTFEVGDTVEVKLVRKKERLYYSPYLARINKFKEEVIKGIFGYLENFKEIKQIFVVGSFLTQQDYNDIDIVLIANAGTIEKRAYLYLAEKMQLKFHIMIIPEDKLLNLLKICPMTKSIMHYFISNKKFELPKEYEENKEHLEFLLMMPEDLLKIRISNGRIYFDAIRRLIAIRRFIEKKSSDPGAIDSEFKRLLGENIYFLLKRNEYLDQRIIDNIKKIIKTELEKIRKKL